MTEANKLINEKSPYLLQHAYNPVNWYPWGEEAFKKAEEEDKPIFLSIGYSTCHWCHVMERESFEDEEVAQVLNDNFISIKVDREERPDVDNIYMTVCQALTGRGGWPLTIVMTPDKRPFFAGTYFPKKSKRGHSGLLCILNRIQSAWKSNKASLLESSEEVISVLRQADERRSTEELSVQEIHDLIEKIFQDFKDLFDEKYGGFRTAPKFPTPHNLMFLLRYWKLTTDHDALHMVQKTLDYMYRGGIYDHIGYGFSRYSTDRQWLVPHFEKMLYDNALLAIVYLELYQITNKKDYAKIAREILDYVLRDMTSPQGGFYSAEDADSEGEEGKFYVWTPQEVKDVLGEKDGSEFCELYDITPEGNFGEKSIPNLIGVKKGKIEIDKKFANLRQRLFEVREDRVHPHKDDKILTSWNGLMIAAMSIASRVLDDKKYLQAAEGAIDFIDNNLIREDGRLLARYREEDAAYLGYVDDYAFLIWGLIELYETNYKAKYLSMALKLNQDLLEYFWDEEEGGLYFYGKDSEELLVRPKEIYDGATPSGNSVATLNFLRLSKLMGKEELMEKAEEQFKFFGGQIKKNPTAYTYFLSALLFMQSKGKEVVIVGEEDQVNTKKMLTTIKKKFSPFTVTLLNNKVEKDELANLAPFVSDQKQIKGKPTAYICEDFTCQAPITDLQKFTKRLNS
ncbi:MULTISPECIES: thioredoxin domain-containing protein [unclassified Candidatus Frackibacter]|uniref:thioredoxin domain-containing protein n=1 Tax=unclassified Candidatus Frackibacter TaxID=2648818 RepID=UPI00088FDC91|nr:MULTISPECIES: thioredoxin domain-containing protein [unclassified Candidatus Frackibacter]SDC36738.1 hypothetical protein SAMN04515661_10810 [Candidatus Frackibacter sp. WG11]SEM63187.1 hypothetical protein SAMN04488698_10979 [Candidatus Frackibacter sp. WG12]SFL64479.1 hypothetical protein SAMN04488699_10810 [Candidatus Frackibacter sp. WG13]